MPRNKKKIPKKPESVQHTYWEKELSGFESVHNRYSVSDPVDIIATEWKWGNKNAMHLPWLECQTVGITTGKAGKASAKCLISVNLYRNLFHISAQCQYPHITKIWPERQLTLLPQPQSIPPKNSYSSLGDNADRTCRTLHRSLRRQRPHSPPNHPRL